MAKAAPARLKLLTLRNTIARIEGMPVALEDRATSDANRQDCLSLGVKAIDDALGGGVQMDALSEIRILETRDSGAATGFVLALCVLALQARADKAGRILWIGETVAGMEAGLPSAEGLLGFGLPPFRLLYARPARLDDALFMAELALGVSAFAAIILEVRGNPQKLGLTESRRLHLRARAAGRPLFLLRQAGEEEASAAPLRLSVRPGLSKARMLPDGSPLKGTIGCPVFHITLEKSRNPGFPDFMMEWNPHERQFYPATQPSSRTVQQTGPADSGTQLPASVHRQDIASEVGNVLAFNRAS
jgi:protein ImuA